MTEREWLTAYDPNFMLELVRPRLSERKWYLMACMVYRHLIKQMNNDTDARIDEFPTLPTASARPRRKRATAQPVANPTTDGTASSEPRTSGYVERVMKIMEKRSTIDRSSSDSATSGYGGSITRRAMEETREYAERTVELSQTALQHLVRTRGEDLFIAMRETVREGMECIEHIRHAFRVMPRIRSIDRRIDNRSTRVTSLEELHSANGAREFAIQNLSAEIQGFVNNLPEILHDMQNQLLGEILHEQLGNPFRPYRFDARWRTNDVIQLARVIHDHHAYDRYPVLVDALIDAHCDDEALLNHLRSSEEHSQATNHCRGCWAIDRILDLDPEVFSCEPLSPENTPERRQVPLGLALPDTFYA